MIPGHHVVSIEVEADSLDDTQGFGANHWRSSVCLDSIHVTESCRARLKAVVDPRRTDDVSLSDSLDADLLCRCRGFSQSLGDWWKSAFASTAALCSECRNGVGVHEVWVNESLLVCVSVSAMPVFITVCFKINHPIWDFVLPSSPRFKTQQNKMSKNAFVSIF